MILNKSQSIYSKILALGILEDLIKSKWRLLPSEQKLGIRNFLVDILIKIVTDDQSFSTQSNYISKLNFVIVQVSRLEMIYIDIHYNDPHIIFIITII